MRLEDEKQPPFLPPPHLSSPSDPFPLDAGRESCQFSPPPFSSLERENISFMHYGEVYRVQSMMNERIFTGLSSATYRMLIEAAVIET